MNTNFLQQMDTNFLQQLWTWRPTTKELSTLFPILLVAYYARGYFQKGLFKVPGPFLGSLSDWYRIFYVVKGRRQDRHQALMHKKYGDVVRYGPNLISFGHPDAIKDIYGIGKSLGKSPFYLPMQAMAKGRAFASLFTILTNKEHSQLKRTISNAFSGSSIVSLEPLVEEVVHDWIKQTEDLYVKTGNTCNLGWWMQLFAFDAITNLTYSTSHGMVKQHRDVDGICTWLEGMFAYAAVVGSMPILDQLWNKNPLKRFVEWAGLSAPSFATVRFTRKRMAERLSRDENDESFAKAQRPDLLGQFIVNSGRHPSVLDQQMVMAQTNSIAFAGSDNTSVTLTAVVWYLLRNPRCYKRVVAELDEATRTGGMPANPYEIPTWAQCQKLTYFNACVKEAGRLHPSVAGILERMTPPEGAYIMGKWYPGNTLVGCNAWVLHHRKDTWGEDADDFRPERWLESSPEDLDKMNRAFFSFSSGPRVCIGRNISLLEIGKLIPVMLRVFDVSLVNPDKDWELRNNFVMKQLGVDVKFKLRQH